MISKTKKSLTALCIIVVTLVGTLFYLGLPNKLPQRLPTKTVDIGGKLLTVQVAQKPHELQKGLMYKKKLQENEGMLFIVDPTNSTEITMQNTLIPLDIIWIAPQKYITDVTKNVPPCPASETYCPTYEPLESNFSYILEVNAGWVDKNNINVSDHITWD